jgi:glutaredoxin
MRRFHWNRLAVGMLATLASVAGAQTLYKSVGADGRVVYGDQPPKTGAVEKTLKLENLPVSVVPGAAPRPSSTSATPPAAVPRGEVVLYMATWCGYCKAAKAYLAQKSIAYRELDIDTPAGKTAFTQIGGRGVPVLLAQGQRINGFSAQAYDAVFVTAKQ